MAFKHKEMVFVFRDEDKLSGIRIEGYIGDVDHLGKAIMEHKDDVGAISKILTESGNTFDKISPYNDLYVSNNKR